MQIPKPMIVRLDRCRGKHGRRAAAVVELAICLPLLVLLVLGSIEISNVVFLRQSLVSVAYEGAQVVTALNGTEAEARVRMQGVLQAFAIQNATITVTPSVTSSTQPGTPIRITVAAPIGPNCPTFGYFFTAGGTISTSVTMNRL